MPGESTITSTRISAILLVLLFSYNAVFAPVTLLVWKVYMNEQIEELAKQLPNEALDHIALPYQQTAAAEIEHNGVMYDVIRFEVRGTYIHYYCVQDFTENALSSATDVTLSGKQTAAKAQWAGHAKQLKKNTSSPYILSHTATPLSPTPAVHLYATFNLLTLAPNRAVHTPPPDRYLI